MRRARAWAESAALRLWVVDASGAAGDWRAAADLASATDLLVLAKSDLPDGSDAAAALASGREFVRVSVAAPGGSEALRLALSERVRRALGGGDFPAVTRLRHRRLLEEGLGHLRRAIDGLASARPELIAEDVRLAARALERLSGRIDAEAVLDRVFASFCIGK